MLKNSRIKEIWQKDKYSLCIKWQDDIVHSFDTFLLRQQCPCSLCIDEWTGKKKKLTIKRQTSIPTIISSVGSYAIAISFQDGHSSGIYTLENLRKFGDNTSIS